MQGTIGLKILVKIARTVFTVSYVIRIHLRPQTYCRPSPMIISRSRSNVFSTLSKQVMESIPKPGIKTAMKQLMIIFRTQCLVILVIIMIRVHKLLSSERTAKQ